MLKKIRLLLVLFLAIMLFGCDGSTGMTVKFHIEGENNVVTVKAKKGEIVMPNDPYIDGFIFDGWYLDDGTFMVEFEPEMLKEMLSSSVVDVYAKWRDTITIIFRAEGAEDIIITLKIGTSPEELPDVPEKTGFFGYWDAVDYSQLRGDTVVQAVYTDASDLKHHINFYCGDTQKQLLVSHGDRVFQYPTFEIDEDYFIEGWYFDEDFTQPFNNEQPINDNLTLYGNISSFYTTEPLGEDLIITGYLGSKSNLVIPEKIFDKVVSGIADSAFADVDFLKTVTIPFTVTTIGEEAFANSSIQEITLPDTLTEIGKSAFAGCTGLTELSIPGSNIQFGVDILTGCTNLESLAVPFGNQLTFLGYLFGAASAAENDLVPESLQSVEARADAISLAAAAFINCTSLTSLRLHGFTSIGEAAFYGCTNIKELELPASLNEIALGALSGLNNLESLTLSFIGETSSKNTYLGHLFGATVASENVNFIPEGLQTITLSYTKTIPENAFLNCSSLVNINLSDGLEEIGAHAFSGCSGLKEINLPSSLISIGFAAFEDCSNLETLVLPFIGETDKTNNYLGHLFGAASALENAQYIPQTLRKVEIYHVTALPSRALYNCSMLEEIILPDDLESIGEEAFALCNGLVSIELASPLKTIQNRAFADCLGLKEAFIPDSVQSIGFAIFEGCDNLENLRVPFLGENFEAFAHLGYFFGAPTYEDNATYVPASLEELVVSDKCYGFGTNAFYECNNLRTVTMFASGIFLDSELMLVFAYDMAGHEAYPWTVPTYPLEAISKLRFWEGFAYFVENNQVRIIRGNNQEVANIPETIEGYPVKTIGYYTFANQKVKTVSLPENLDVIEDYAFYNCTDLEVISLPERLDSIGKSAFAYCEALESITLPDNLTIISESLFRHCSELQNVVLPRYLEKISIYAFTECTSITDLSLSTSVYLIEGYAFDNSGINSIVIPNSEAYIEYNAFVNCDNLESITLHWKDNRDFSAIFDERANTVLKEITILEGCVAIKNREFSGYTALERITLPDTVTSIGYSAFNGCTKLANIRLPKNLTIIDENTFFNCSSLEEITLPEKLTDINYGAFRNCTRLMHIDFPATLTQIIDRAFEGCSSLAEVYLPLNITFIGQDAFNTGVNTLFLCAAPELPERWSQNWAGLSQNIHWNIDYEQIGRFEKMLYLIEGNAVTILSVDQDVVELIIPEQIAGFPVTKIRSWAIKYCENLRKLVIPDTTLTIEAGAIVATRGIQSLTLPFLGGSRSDNEPLSYIFYGNYGYDTLQEIILNSTESLPDYAFSNCTNLKSFVVNEGVTAIGDYAFNNCTSLESISLPNTLLSIGEYAFAYANLSRVVIPDSVQTMGKAIFYYNDFLESLTLPFIGDVDHSYISYLFGGESYNDNYAIPMSLATIILSNQCTIIPDYAFYGANYLLNLTMGKNIESIGANAFYQCSRLSQVKFSEKLQSIGEYAFYQCSALKTITLASEIIKKGAFNGCTSLTGVFLSSLTDLGEEAFAGCSLLDSVELPDNLESIGKRAFGECVAITALYIPEQVQSIGQNALQGCANLMRLTLPFVGGTRDDNNRFTYIFGTLPSTLEKVIFIDSPVIRYASFQGINQMLSIYLPTDIEVIEVNAFINCPNIIIFCESVSKPEGWQLDWNSGLPTYWGVNSDHEIGVYLVYSYYADGKQVTITDVNSDESVLVVPDKISGLPVRKIGFEAFAHLENLTEVTLPESLLIIGEDAFESCIHLETINIPEGVTEIAYGAFRDCVNLTSIVLPQNLTYIAERLFSDCTNLLTVIMPTGLDYIGSHAFYRCTSLRSITIDANSIYESAFEECSALVEVELSENVRTVRNSAFAYCTSLQTITLPALEKVADRMFYFCTSLEEVNFTAGTLEIGAHAFEGCESLVSASLPLGLLKIYEYAFFNCVNLESVEMHNELGEIDAYAFGNCVKMASVTLSDRLIGLSDNLFSNCAMLEAITIPRSVSRIGDNVFQNSGLKEIIIPETVDIIGSNIFYGCQALEKVTLPFVGSSIYQSTHLGYFFGATNFNYNKQNVPASLKEVVVSSGCTSIAANAFYECENLETVILPKTITQVGANAFVRCSNITHLTLPFVGATRETENELGYYFNGNLYIPSTLISVEVLDLYNTAHSFADCIYIQTVVLPANLEVLGEAIFQNCYSLTSITLPEGLKAISDNAFENCYSLTSLVIPKTVKTIGEAAFATCSGLVTLELPSSLETIGERAFASCSLLEAVSLPEGLLGIGDAAFRNCLLLSEIVIPTSVQTIGINAFGGCSGLTKMTLPYVGITRTEQTYLTHLFGASSPTDMVTMPAGLTEIILTDCTEIPAYAFYDLSQIRKVTFPNSVSEIGEYAFYQCSRLEPMALPTELTSIGEYAFAYCWNTESLSLPESLDEIGFGAFLSCQFKSITLPFIGGSVTTNQHFGYIFGAYSYNDQKDSIPSALVRVTLLDDILSIPDYAFYGCEKIETINLPDGLKTIGEAAFRNCTNLNIYLPDGLEEIGNSAFMNCGGLVDLFIPQSVVSIGYAAFANTNLEKINLPFVGGSATTNQYLGYIFGAMYASSSNDYVPSSLKEVVVSEPCNYLGIAAFAYLTNITKISLPASLETIEERAFYLCRSLETIEISMDNPYYVVQNNTLLSKDLSELVYVLGGSEETTYVIPATVTRIKTYAFSDCINLCVVYIPNTVHTIDNVAFPDSAVEHNNMVLLCEPSLKPAGWANNWYFGTYDLYWGVNEYYYDGDFIYLLENSEIILIKCLSSDEEIIVPDTFEGYPVTKIGNYAFYKSPATTIALPDGLREIGDYAFSECLNIEYMTIPETVIRIGNSAFRYSVNMYLIINHQISEIDNFAFDQTAFIEELVDEDGFAILNKQLIRYLGTIQNVVVPNDVEMIAKGAFIGCSMESLSLPFIGGSPTENTYIGYIFGSPAVNYHDSYLPRALKEVIIQEGCTEIGVDAFMYCSYITDIIVPTSVERIANSAFDLCTGLINLTLPFVGGSREANQSLAYIFGAPDYSNIWFVPASLKKVRILGGEIADYAFYKLDRITDIIIEDDVTAIGDYAFYYCLNLSNVTLPENLTDIGSFAFDYTPWLSAQQDANGLVIVNNILIRSLYTGTDLVIPEVDRIVRGALSGNDDLINLSIPFIGEAPYINSHFSFIFGNEETVPASLKKIIVQEGITSINSLVFANLSFVTEIVLPNSVSSIGTGAFKNCIKLTKINLPVGLQDLANNVFEGCVALENIYLPDALENIGEAAFKGCTLLRTITFPDNLQTIGKYAFQATALTEVYVPTAVQSIGQYAFYQCGLVRIYLPFIGGSTDSNQFLGYIFGAGSANLNISYIPTTLKYVTILPGCTSISSGAFLGCTNLFTLTIPESVQTIDGTPFYNCPNLIILCKGATQPEGWVENWNYGRPVYFGVEEDVRWTEDLYYLIYDDEIVIVSAKKDITDFAIPTEIDGVAITSIGSLAFEQCTLLESINISGNIQEIGSEAFKNCTALTEVVIGDNVVRIGKGAFFGCEQIQTMTLPFVGETATTNQFIGYIFGYNNEIERNDKVSAALKTVTITEGCISIGDYAFSHCTNIEYVYLPISIESIGAYAFYMCSELQEMILPEIVKSIGDFAFNSCLSLSVLELPDGLLSIGASVFYNSPLTSVFIPETVTYIGAFAFQHIDGLTIYLETESQPETWDGDWNEYNTLVWGATRP